MVAQRQRINKAEAQIRARHPRSHAGTKAKFVERGVAVTPSEGWDGDSASAAQAGGRRTELFKEALVFRRSCTSTGLLISVSLCLWVCARGSGG